MDFDALFERYEQLKRRHRWGSLIAQAWEETCAIDTGDYVPQPAHRRLAMPIEPTPKADRPECGAKCRDGHACRAKVVDGRSRCRLHGGLSSGPKTAEGKARIAESNCRRARTLMCTLKKDEALPKRTTCPVCGGMRFYRQPWEATWTCARCRPPVGLHPTNVLWQVGL